MKRFLVLVMFISCFSYAFISGGQADGPILDKQAPDFTLIGANGKEYSLSDFTGKYVVLEWINPDCPFVRKHYNSSNMQKLQKHYTEKDVVWLTISSSAPGKQGYCTPDRAREFLKEKDMTSTAFLLDHDGKVGKLYNAKTTPHMFVINKAGVLIYHGAIDDKPSTKLADIDSARNYVQSALEEAIAGTKISVKQTQSYGCSVKYATN